MVSSTDFGWTPVHRQVYSCWSWAGRTACCWTYLLRNYPITYMSLHFVAVSTDISEQVVANAALFSWSQLDSSWVLQRNASWCTWPWPYKYQGIHWSFLTVSLNSLAADILGQACWPFTTFSHLVYAMLKIIFWKNPFQTTGRDCDQLICTSQSYLVRLCQVHTVWLQPRLNTV